MSPARPHALIIGGGIAGPALALFLQKAGITATVFEARAGRDDHGAGLQVSPNGMHVLAALGLAERLSALGHVSPAIRFRNHRGCDLARISNGPAEKYGQPAVVIARAVLNRCLMDELQRQGITVAYGKRLAAVSQEGDRVTARFEDGSTASGDFLVGADGIRSRTRELILPDGPKPRYTGLLNVGGFASVSILNGEPSALAGDTVMTFGLGGFFGYARCAPDTLMWWSNLPRETPTRGALASDTEDIRSELLAIHAGWPGPIASIIDQAPTIFQADIEDLAPLPRWHQGRVVLIGDAAHAMSPHAGQGASTSLEDAMVLAKLLRDMPGSPEAAFAMFERDRRPRVEKIIAQARRNGDSKKVFSPIGAWMRDRLLSFVLPRLSEGLQDWVFAYRVNWDGGTSLQRMEEANISAQH